ncbi:hypothetical protein [Flavobacterium sp.]|uniref:hypothetical protein n=1 Tax=Flavobacterium sp. TaxID=239 RepID=UPI0039E3832E
MNTIQNKSLWFLVAAVAVSGGLNAYLLQTDHPALFFLLPPASWSLALLLPIHSQLKDKRFAYFLFPSAIFCLWMAMLVLSVTLGNILLKASPSIAYPIIGGIAAWASYLLYAHLVLSRFSAAVSVFSFAMGYVAFVLNSFVEPSDKIFLEQKTTLFLLWQILTGAGHALAYYKFCSAKTESVTS